MVSNSHNSQLFTKILSDSDEPEWVIEQARARKRREMLCSREDMENRLAKIRAKEKAERDRYMRGEQHHKKRRIDFGKTNEDNEEQYMLDDYDSDREQTGSKFGGTESGLSAETVALLRQAGIGLQALKEEDEEAEDEIKACYMSLQDSVSDKSRSSSVHEHTPNSPNSSMNYADPNSRLPSKTTLPILQNSKT